MPDCGKRRQPMAKNAKKAEKMLYPNSRKNLTKAACYATIIGLVHSGAMAERLKALVLKTSDTERYRGFESLSLRQP